MEPLDVPILGIVENMAYFTPAELPDAKYYIFGKDGCKQLADLLDIPLLAQIPIVQSISNQGMPENRLLRMKHPLRGELFQF